MRSVTSGLMLAAHEITACVILFGLSAAAAGVGCSRPAIVRPAQQTTAASDAIPVADRAPMSLVQLGRSAKGLFDAADASDWTAAKESIQSINESASVLVTPRSKQDLSLQLRSLLTGAQEHVKAKERIGTMDDANAITRIVAELTALFRPQEPYDVMMLGYYGRQLELGVAASRPSILNRARTDLQSTWNRVEPVIERRGQIDDARRFTDIVVQLDGAQRPADFVTPTRAALAAADRIEKLFQSSS
jgi:hypothetical protein